jgi:hypothetical protein
LHQRGHCRVRIDRAVTRKIARSILPAVGINRANRAQRLITRQVVPDCEARPDEKRARAYRDHEVFHSQPVAALAGRNHITCTP